MFGNRYVNYGGPGGVRRGLIWQSGDVGGTDPCEVSKEWGEWTNPGYFDVHQLIILTFNSFKYDVFKEEFERRDPTMNEERFNSMVQGWKEEALHYYDLWHTSDYNGIALVTVGCRQWQPLTTWVYEYWWSITTYKNTEIRGYYDTILGHYPDSGGPGIHVKPSDTLDHHYEWEYIRRQFDYGVHPTYLRETGSSNDNDAWITYLTGYSGAGRFAQLYYESHIPNCVVSPCPISHWIGNNVDIHY